MVNMRELLIKGMLAHGINISKILLDNFALCTIIQLRHIIH